MSNFTPGPWEVSLADTVVVRTGERTKCLIAQVAGIKIHREETEANTRLIALAPEMYELLRGELIDGDAGVLSFAREAKLRKIVERVEGGATE